jgi:hypothetical protein
MKKPLLLTQRTSSKAGQSLIELALFTSILVSAMALMLNYIFNYSNNQAMAMMALKRAMHLATEASSTYLSSSVTLVYDKAIANPTNMFGMPNMTPLIVSSSGLRSNDLFSELDGTDEEIPRVVFDINGKKYEFKTAAYINLPGQVTAENARRKAFIDGWDGVNPEKSWQWEVPDPEGKDEKRKFDKKTEWDLDGDGQEERVLSIDDSLVLDNQRGELDLGIDDPERKQGLLSDTQTMETQKGTLNVSHVGRTDTTSTRHENTYIATRRIRLNSNDVNGLSGVRQQIAVNNNNCYGRGSPCAADEQDELLETGNEKILIVRSKLGGTKGLYEWTKQR